MEQDSADLTVTREGHVAIVEFSRPPHNHFDHALVAALAGAFERLDKDAGCRAILLCSAGKSFCAGANLARASGDGEAIPGARFPHVYKEGLRLFRTAKPIVAAVQGPAIGAGVGLALVADFRVGCPETRFSTNFSKIGFHPGFAITATLPHVVGHQHAAAMLYTGRRLKGEEALRIGLLDELTTLDDVRAAAMRLAREIAEAAPLAVMSIRQTLRRGVLDRIEAATERELVEQNWLKLTEDFVEGRAAVDARRTADFRGR
jgi:enoyl-CoA hydratase/carnithine racemase